VGFGLQNTILICGVDISHRCTGYTIIHQTHTNQHFMVRFKHVLIAEYSADLNTFNAEYLVNNEMGFLT
jgi:hypothetical protein